MSIVDELSSMRFFPFTHQMMRTCLLGCVPYHPVYIRKQIRGHTWKCLPKATPYTLRRNSSPAWPTPLPSLANCWSLIDSHPNASCGKLGKLDRGLWIRLRYQYDSSSWIPKSDWKLLKYNSSSDSHTVHHIASPDLPKTSPRRLLPDSSQPRCDSLAAQAQRPAASLPMASAVRGITGLKRSLTAGSGKSQVKMDAVPRMESLLKHSSFYYIHARFFWTDFWPHPTTSQGTSPITENE